MSEVERYYDASAAQEWARLQRFPMESAVTRHALTEYLPTPPARILDVGGGPGRYAIALAQQGYAVTLVDTSQGCLDVARAKAAEAGVELAGYVHGTALDLSQFAADSSAAVLLMGPLYHLATAEDRRLAVAEAARVLRPDGLLFAAIITRYALIRWAAKHAPEWLLRHRDAAEAMLQTGVAMGDREVSFTDAYYAHPSELALLLQEQGFEVLASIACEGVVSMIDEQLRALTDEPWRIWVELNYRLGKDPTVHGAAEHVLGIGKRPARQIA